MKVTIKKLIPELVDDFLYYFDKIGFSNNPNWSGCYCYFHHCPGTAQDWMKRSKEQNRKDSKQLILTGKLNGFLAYDDTTPIGWINVDLKENYLKLPVDREIDVLKDGKIASIVCFLIAPAYRRKGIARKLLQESLKHLKNNGIKWVESYPRIGELSDAHSYHGPSSLYKAEGFVIIKEFENMYVMQKKL
jgi:ribosomal protein S18 acetylase RimI-like enzyme